MIWSRPTTLIDARVVTPGGIAESIRFGSRILSIGCGPGRGDRVISAAGAWIVPGLVNAHDHLELNHYGQQVARAPYRHVREWVEDMRPRLAADPQLAAGRRRPLDARLFAGGLKNLLSGVTLVAHHNPLYPRVRRVSPTKVLRRFGWAHSLTMQSEPVGANGERGGDVAQRYAHTPPDAPFMVHVAEGIDATAAAELDTLDAAGVLTARTVLVHVVAASPERRAELAERGVGLVWCPASNLALLGTTWEWTAPAPLSGRMALATDSRLTGSRDLLDEVRVAAATVGLPASDWLAMVTHVPAALLRARDAGRLEVGQPADFVVLSANHDSAGDALMASRRADLRLVVTDGRPRVGAETFAAVFAARGVPTARINLDGAPRLLDRAVLTSYVRYGIAEPGLRVVTA